MVETIIEQNDAREIEFKLGSSIDNMTEEDEASSFADLEIPEPITSSMNSMLLMRSEE